MRKVAILVLPLLGVCAASGQTPKKMPVKAPGTEKPVCSPGAICFSGRVSDGQSFYKPLNGDLSFALRGSRNDHGWSILIVPRRAEETCHEFTDVVNGPHHAHKEIWIDMSYGWAAETEVGMSPREFRFATNCGDYRTEYERLTIVLGATPVSEAKYDETLAKLGSLATGKGRLWITNSQISHAGDTDDDKTGKIEWMTFTVEIILPR
jgi:hypothetical protein